MVEKDEKKEKKSLIESEKEKTKTAIENEKTGKRELTGAVQQTQIFRKGYRGHIEVVAGGKTEFSKRKEGKSAQNNIIAVNKKRKDYAS